MVKRKETHPAQARLWIKADFLSVQLAEVQVAIPRAAQR